jgi:hypothetical protein
MQFVESSVVGIIEVDTATPADFDSLARRRDLAAIRPGDIRPLSTAAPAKRWDTSEDLAHRPAATICANASADHPLRGARDSRRGLSGTGRLSADLPRLEQDLGTALQQLRREMAVLPHRTNS